MTTELAPKTNAEITKLFAPQSKPHIPVDAPLPVLNIMREKPMYELPDGQLVPEVTGHILYWHNANQYYSTAFGGGNETAPPTCSSSNGVRPDGGTDPLCGPCRTCPMNEWGSDGEGRAKKCQNTIRLYLLLDGDVLPCMLKAPPSSLGKGSLNKWLTNATNVAFKAGFGYETCPIKVKFKLHTRQFPSGFSASIIDVETVRVLSTATDMDEIKKLASYQKELMEAYVANIRDVVATEGSDKDVPF